MKSAVKISSLPTLTLSASLFLAGCLPVQPRVDETYEAEYAYQRSRLAKSMTEAEVEAEIGTAPFYEAKRENGDISCALFRDTSRDGDAIIHDIRYENGKLLDNNVGLDLGLAACDPYAAL